MPNLGDVSRSVGASRVGMTAGALGENAGSVTVDVPVSGAPYLVLIQEGSLVRVTRASGGHAYFYDLDDGVYYAHSVEAAAAWRVTITAGVATVESLSSGGGSGPALQLVNGRLQYGETVSPGSRLVAYLPP